MARILLVEDHAALATLRSVLLQQRGHEILSTEDGQKACRLLEQEPFDLVITDSKLPSGSGKQVAAAAKKKGVPVILSTGWPQRAARLAEVDFVARKPSSIEQFLALVNRALRKAPKTSR